MYHAAQQCSVLHNNVVCCTTYHAAQQCGVLHNNVSCCTTMWCAAQQCSVPFKVNRKQITLIMHDLGLSQRQSKVFNNSGMWHCHCHWSGSSLHLKGLQCLPCSWFRHCTTSWKVTGSIPDGVTGIFHWHNPFSRTMALGLTQPLEMSTRNISWEVKAAGA
jgi:hypothetical protein